jgi:hypothetical protein
MRKLLSPFLFFRPFGQVVRPDPHRVDGPTFGPATRCGIGPFGLICLSH